MSPHGRPLSIGYDPYLDISFGSPSRIRAAPSQRRQWNLAARSSERRGREKFLWILVLIPHEAASMAQVVNELPWHLRNHAAVRFSQRVCAKFVKNIPARLSPQFIHQLGLA